MTLVATPADAEANSYLTVEDADALAGDDLGPEAQAWLDALADVKERALKRATWAPFDRTAQRLSHLRFPREVDTDAAGDPIIPREVELATYQQAIYLVRNARAIAAAATRAAQGADSMSEENHSWSQRSGGSVLCDRAQHYLTGFAVAPASRGGAGSLRSVRVGSGFIGSS